MENKIKHVKSTRILEAIIRKVKPRVVTSLAAAMVRLVVWKTEIQEEINTLASHHVSC